ncbi:B3/B4 domain-containing protein [Wielerella bovis]|uniref:B3/B4 domain-containing protein n=1 Tax=Wielerella bovis TaxID=2917790 RepID=UPI002019DAFE|nr:B3/4 domain-containing protein [Wielerella bovis]MCG7657649.1 B3/4 domain-containing protein [Wielerella bovis]MCG7659870.1 B3/4 domain-containing protein [Wielerella bovis]
MTKQFIAESSFWQLFPQAQLAVLVLDNVNNQGESNAKITDLLAHANGAAKKHLTAEPLSQNPAVAVWREAYQKFKTKKGVRCSIEALLKRVENGKGVGCISPLVDIYNAASLTFALPCGAEDVDTFVGSLKLRITEGGDEFLALGDEENSPTLAGELCYTDDVGAVCRCFNWRDGKRTMVTENTRRAFVILEYPNSSREADLRAALDFIAQHA